MSTKFAVTSDLHGRSLPNDYLERLDGCAALLICGDIFNTGPGWPDDESKLLRQLKDIYDHKIRVVCTPGNHDTHIYEWYCAKGLGEMDEEYMNGVRRMFGTSQWSPLGLNTLVGIETLIDDVAEVNGVKIYGTPWCPHFCGWAFMGSNTFLNKKFKEIPEGVDILISHGPPRFEDSSIDVVEGTFRHCGSKALATAILEKKPKYAFSGHIHTGSHEIYDTGNTKCANVSYIDEAYKPKYDFRYVEI